MSRVAPELAWIDPIGDQRAEFNLVRIDLRRLDRSRTGLPAKLGEAVEINYHTSRMMA